MAVNYKKAILFSIITLCFCTLGKAQNLAADSVLTLETFIQQVKQFHPVAKQANLQTQKAKAELLTAKGSFDPTISLDASRKTFDEKNYYFYTNPELKIPLPVGDLKTGLENNGGDNLSSELTKGKSSYLGIEIPLAKGLLIDKRRAALQQAKIYVNQTEQERLAMYNDLLYSAYSSYAQWAGYHQLYKTFTNYLQVSAKRLGLVKIAAANGDRSVMDTLEAFTQLQNIELLQNEALIKLNTAAYELSNFLWLQNDSAYQLSATVQPSNQSLLNIVNINSADDIVTNALTQNPNIRYYNFKLDVLQVERKLKQQNLLPTLNAKANLLNKDYAVLKGFSTAFLQNNYKWGIDFKIPIFLREGRGELQKAKLKITEANLDLLQKKQTTENKIRSYYAEFTLLQQQLKTAQTAYNNYNSLYKNELLRFTNGESSLFVVNSREIKALETLQKTIELQIKLFKARYAIDWAAGALK